MYQIDTQLLGQQLHAERLSRATNLHRLSVGSPVQPRRKTRVRFGDAFVTAGNRLAAFGNRLGDRIGAAAPPPACSPPTRP
jgi:hypothetical protein